MANNGGARPTRLDTKTLDEMGGHTGITLRRGLLVERMELEDSMFFICVKIAIFFTYFGSFLFALNAFFPAEKLAGVHGQLRAHYGLDAETITGISTVSALFEFIQNFEEKNRALVPTSDIYWCDPRFLKARAASASASGSGGQCDAGGGHRRLTPDWMLSAESNRYDEEMLGRRLGGSSYSASASTYSSTYSSSYSYSSGYSSTYSGGYSSYSAAANTDMVVNECEPSGSGIDMELTPFFANPQNFGGYLTLWDCCAPSFDQLETLRVARNIGGQYGDTMIIAELIYTLTTNTENPSYWVDDPGKAFPTVVPEITGDDYDFGPVCKALIDDLHLTIPTPSCVVTSAIPLNFHVYARRERQLQDNLDSFLEYAGISEWAPVLRQHNFTLEALHAVGEDQLARVLPLGPRRAIQSHRPALERMLVAAASDTPRLVAELLIAGRSPLESIMIEHAIHAARLDTDQVLKYTRKAFKAVNRPDTKYPLGVNIDFSMVSIEEIREDVQFHGTIESVVIGPYDQGNQNSLALVLGPGLKNYIAVFESCYEAMVAMLASEKYPITKKNLIFTANDWLMDGDVVPNPNKNGTAGGGGGGHRRTSQVPIDLDRSGEIQDFLEFYEPELMRYLPQLRTAGISPRSLVHVSDDDLKLLGIPTVARKIFKRLSYGSFEETPLHRRAKMLMQHRAKLTDPEAADQQRRLEQRRLGGGGGEDEGEEGEEGEGGAKKGKATFDGNQGHAARA
jgi:hypothetical protein